MDWKMKTGTERGSPKDSDLKRGKGWETRRETRRVTLRSFLREIGCLRETVKGTPRGILRG